MAISGIHQNGMKELIKAKADELGFDIVGVCRPDYSPQDHNQLLEWLNRGYHGDMDYMARKPRQRADPRLLMPDVRSIVVVGLTYFREPDYEPDKPYVSIYARGAPYQEVIRTRLKKLLTFIKFHDEQAKGKIAVDTSPTLDKNWAVRAGIGWRGKNTVIINEHLGSFMFIGELFLNLDIEPDQPAPDHCGECRKCLEACPTGALEKPYLLDATRCISYLTIELKNPESSAELIGNHIIGCDICQLVCPFNKAAPETGQPEFRRQIDLEIDFGNNWAHISEAEFKNRYAGTILAKYGFNKYKKMAGIVRDNLDSVKIS